MNVPEEDKSLWITAGIFIEKHKLELGIAKDNSWAAWPAYMAREGRVGRTPIDAIFKCEEHLRCDLGWK